VVFQRSLKRIGNKEIVDLRMPNGIMGYVLMSAGEWLRANG
jgi:hypothetical protein